MNNNLAFKCTWNDAGFEGVCSKDAWKYNISKNRVWCRKAKCQTFKSTPSEKDHPCYESIIFTKWRFGAGWDHKNIERPRNIKNVKVGKIALLTTVEPNKEEKERKIIGYLKIKEIDQGHQKETIIYGDSDRSLKIDPRFNIKFWKYYRNPRAQNKIAWNTGLFRYVPDEVILNFLIDLKEKYSEKHLSQNIIRKIEENIKDYEKHNGDKQRVNKKIDKEKICPYCRHKNLVLAKFCNKCGKEFGRECPKCNTVNPEGSKYCFECGNRLTGLSQNNEIEIIEKLLEFGQLKLKEPRSWMFTPDKEADSLVKRDKNAFLFAVILDQGIDAEKAWAAPYELKKRIGHLDPKLLAEFTDQQLEAFFKTPFKLHRFWHTMVRRIKNACAILNEKYADDAKNIWSDETDSIVLFNRLKEFEGIGQKKASMTVNILFRDLGLKIKNKEGIDVSYDEMVRRVFLRTGLAKRDNINEILRAARRLNPEYPGELDYPAWLIGREFCLPTNPKCNKCYLGNVCPKLRIWVSSPS
jgi:uncharacterized HhH-GPD family protein